MFNSQMYYSYLSELRKNLFGDLSIEDILENIKYSYAERRFINMYLMQDAQTFWFYYNIRYEKELTGIFDQIISGLFSDMNNCSIKADLISKLGINETMVESSVSTFQIKELIKDLYAFSWYARKRVMSVQEIREGLFI